MNPDHEGAQGAVPDVRAGVCLEVIALAHGGGPATYVTLFGYLP